MNNIKNKTKGKKNKISLLEIERGGGTIYSFRLNKVCVYLKVTRIEREPEEEWRWAHQPKRCDDNNKDENISLDVNNVKKASFAMSLPLLPLLYFLIHPQCFFCFFLLSRNLIIFLNV